MGLVACSKDDAPESAKSGGPRAASPATRAVPDDAAAGALPGDTAAAMPASYRNVAHLRVRSFVAGQTAAAYSPDGKHFVSAGHDLVLFDVATRRQRALLDSGGDGGAALAISFSPDSQELAVLYQPIASSAREIRILSIPDGAEKIRFEAPPAARNERHKIAYSPDGTHVATSGQGQILVYEVASGKTSWTWRKDRKRNRNGSYAAFDVTPDWKYFLYDLERIEYPSKRMSKAPLWDKSKKPFWDQAISPDGKRAFAVGGDNGSIRKLFDLETRTLLAEAKCQNGFSSVIVTTSPERLVSGQCVWNPEDDPPLEFKTPYRLSGLGALALSPDGSELTVGSIFFPLEKAEMVGRPGQPDAAPPEKDWMEHVGSGSSIGYFFGARPNQLIVTSSNIHSVPVLRAAGGAAVDFETGKWDDEGVSKVDGVHLPGAASPNRTCFVINRRHLVCIEADGRREVSLVTPALEKRSRRWKAALGGDEWVALSSEEELVVWNHTQGGPGKPHAKKQSRALFSTLLSPDGRWLAEYSGDLAKSSKQLRVYDARSGKVAWQDEDALSYEMAFSGDGALWIRAAGRKIELVRTDDWSVTKTLHIHTGSVRYLDVSGDGRHLLVANQNGRGEVFDIATGKVVTTVLAAYGEDRFRPSVVVLDEEGAFLSKTGDAADEAFFSSFE